MNGHVISSAAADEHALRANALSATLSPSRAARALAAFCIILDRMTSQATLRVTVAAHGTSTPLEVLVSPGQTVSALIDHVNRALTLFAPHAHGATDVTLAFAGPDTPTLELEIDLVTMTVRLLGSSAHDPSGAVSLVRAARWFDAAASALAPDARVEEVSLLDARERARVLGRWSRGACLPELLEATLVHQLFEASVRRFPDRVAVRLAKEELTYAELDARSSRLAQRLRAFGVARGDHVAFQLARSTEVYVAILGVLKAGAAYVPLDPDYPQDRVRYILADCRAAVLLTTNGEAARHRGAPCPLMLLDADGDDPPRYERTQRPVEPDDPCYVIYTSGSTGSPKGVSVSHRSVAHLIRAEQALFHVDENDRVFQGFSVAFDAAVEEVWLAFAAGGTLVVGTLDVMLDGLDRFLTAQGVTVFSTVPTLLATLEGELPTVRLLIVGGEACPAYLADRFATPGRRMVNTYGPTEATVIATAGDLARRSSVTIGRPIPNYDVYILDAARKPVPAGLPGQIHIGGPGLARGYVGNASLTAEKFVACSFAGEHGAPPLLYATGDLGRFDATGNIEFLGRVDDQVKLRGFRIELGEVENALLRCEEITQAAVSIREDSGAPLLVAYVVLRHGSELDGSIRERLRTSLPTPMLPSHYVVLDRLPTLTSGKVDKKSLPPPSTRVAASSSDVVTADASAAVVRPPCALTNKIARAWAQIFGVERVYADDDFFTDLGGHSLLAARMVSTLRGQQGELASLSILDVYNHSTPSRLAAHVVRSSDAPKAERVAAPAAVSRATRAACALAQAAGIYVVAGTSSMQWLAPYITWLWLCAAGWPTTPALLAALGALLGVYPMMLAFAVAAKWTILGRTRTGRFPLWGAYFVRWWLVDRILAVAPIHLLRGTPLLAAYLRLLGADIGENVHLGTESGTTPDLISIGADSTIGASAVLGPASVEDGMLILERVRIGARCTVGARSYVAGGVTMHDDAELGELSLLPRGTTVGANESWRGSPACATESPEERRPVIRPSATKRGAFSALYVVLVLLLPLLVLVPIAPGLVALHLLHQRWGSLYLLATPLVSAVFTVSMSLAIALLKWSLLGKVKPGTHDVFSGFFARKWLFDQAISWSLDFLGGMYATLYLRPFYRLLGVTMGRGAEVSTASDVVPDLLSIGEGAFVADCASLGAPRIRRGVMELAEARVGPRAFVGNSAVLPAGVDLAEDALVGVLSIAPEGGAAAARDATWLGSPAIALPQRQAAPAFDASSTYEPTPSLVRRRLAAELVRVLGPTTGVVLATCGLLDLSGWLLTQVSPWQYVAIFPLLYLGIAIGAAAAVVLIKWALIGRYEAGQKPLWNGFVWRTEIVTAMAENLADPLLNELLKGTPFLPWFFRALGAKIGTGVYMATTQLTEYDLITIRDGACLDADCTLQTHLFEDRVMKMSHVHVGRGCSIGAESVVLYDTCMAAGARLAPLSLLMKGEHLPAHSCWQGIPARRPRREASS